MMKTKIKVSVDNKNEQKYSDFLDDVKKSGKEIDKPLKIAIGYKLAGCKEPETLIIGTTPSPTGYEKGFYYMSEGNNFWQLLQNSLNHIDKKSKLYEYKEEYNKNIDNEKEIKKIISKIEIELDKHKIAIVDVFEVCYKINGYDSSIVFGYLRSKEFFEKIINKRVKRIIFTSSNSQTYFNKITKEYRHLYVKPRPTSPSGSLKKPKDITEVDVKSWCNALKWENTK